MSKQISTIGYDIPGGNGNHIDFYGDLSLMDADILLISPDSLTPVGNWVDFTLSDGGCYNVEASKKYKQKISRLKKEIGDHLRMGKSVFIFLTQEKKEYLASSLSTSNKGQTTYSTEMYSNYNFLPIDIGRLTSASGRKIQFSGNPIFSNFHNIFKENLEYQLYVENSNEAQVVFTGKDKTKILGAIYKVGEGHLVTLPILSFDEEEFTEIKKDEDGEENDFWNKKGEAFGSNFIKCLLEIDSRLTDGSEKTPAPEWISKKQFLSKVENNLNDSINRNCKMIAKIERENEDLKAELEEEVKLKDLLFEQGKPLEYAVIKALKILGYQAENYDDGDLEMDQVIISPEKHRYIGESEGKDNKDLNVTKFRQLVDALNADFTRDEVDEKAFGILFGNAERLKDPTERKLDFTTKCISGAKREKIALVKTTDLFLIAKYISENKDEDFKKKCRESIHSQLGLIVKFPEIPTKEMDPQAKPVQFE
ncbi:MAG: hypothetical protein WCT33_05275 [Patescibacteria group bacterium]|jgi:hypothetical protein